MKYKKKVHIDIQYLDHFQNLYIISYFVFDFPKSCVIWKIRGSEKEKHGSGLCRRPIIASV